MGGLVINYLILVVLISLVITKLYFVVIDLLTKKGEKT